MSRWRCWAVSSQPRRLAAHGRPRAARRRRLALPHGPLEGGHRTRRPDRLAARGRGGRARHPAIEPSSASHSRCCTRCSAGPSRSASSRVDPRLTTTPTTATKARAVRASRRSLREETRARQGHRLVVVVVVHRRLVARSSIPAASSLSPSSNLPSSSSPSFGIVVYHRRRRRRAWATRSHSASARGKYYWSYSLTSIGSRLRWFTQDNLSDLRSGGTPRPHRLR